MALTCGGPGCKSHSFATERGLSVHRAACEHFKLGEAKAAAARVQSRKVLQLNRAAAQANAAKGSLEVQAESAVVPSGSIASLPDTLPPVPTCGTVLNPPFCNLLPSSENNNPPLTTQSGRPWRPHRLPARYIDHMPVGPSTLPSVAPGSTALPRVISHVQDVLITTHNRFGLRREYPHRPSYDPDSAVPDEHLSSYYSKYQPRQDGATSTAPSAYHLPPWPFDSMSVYLLMQWLHTGSQLKSDGEADRLVQSVLCHPEFVLEDVTGFRTQRQAAILDNSDSSTTDAAPFLADGWQESSVEISVPLGKEDKRGLFAPFTVHGLHHRSLLSVMKAALADASARYFHFSPFRRFWKPPNGPDQRVFDEAYTSDAWLEEHEKLQEQANEPDCKLEKVVLGLLCWSDSTHLTSFGMAKLWPLYVYIANLSKYFRGRPGSAAAHHIAYIPSLPDSIQDFLGPENGVKSKVITHCRRELMHKVLDKVFDAEFVHAYRHGFKMECLDGVWRRFYPRIFSYSADYPEKALISLIRANGRCPCPRCYVEKGDIHRLGQAKDRQTRTKARSYLGDIISKARRFIYETGNIVSSTIVEALLFARSLVPTVSTLAEKLSPFGFDPHEIMVVDLMHEFELGVWKSVFIHLIRILHAAAPAGRLVAELDRRYRMMPTFGHSKIRKFTTNVSEMKKLAAHNYEDLLQCAAPAFEGLLPEPHNKIVMTLLFRLAEWHALAKLRMHTEATLTLLDVSTTILGQELRRFSRMTCAFYFTKLLPAEVAARERRQARQKVKAASTLASTVVGSSSSLPTVAMAGESLQSSSSTAMAVPGPSAGQSAKQKQPSAGKKSFSLWTYKIHALGDYVRSIRRHGTTDSYSTQTGELEHRRVKRLYARTNKRHAVRQITKRERRETRLLRARRAAEAERKSEEREHAHHVLFSQDDTLATTHPEMHHHISDSRRYGEDAFSLSRVLPEDPASKDFLPRLKDHLLGRLLGLEYDGDEKAFSDADRATVRIIDNRVNFAKVFRVNYTTYDLQRDQDSMNPRNRCDVMVMSPETGPNAHPYWYARVIGVFHVRVLHTGPDSKNKSYQHMEFLWVRWLGIVPGHRYGFKAARLPKFGFVPETSPDPFGFLDPSLVIRGCHLIPAFNDLRTSDLLSANPSAGRPIGDTDDWRAFYVNWFADRDMLMRYVGGGVGHAHQNRETPEEDAMHVDHAPDPRDDIIEDAMDTNSDGEDDDAGIYENQSDSEGDEGHGRDDSDDDDLGPEDGEVEVMDFE
ncbi:hypothetical protein HWV62_6005 [Athelia sp. TMB]|nr:hypothetical protein HWV62_6005 [Athelia sp. TMB]